MSLVYLESLPFDPWQSLASYTAEHHLDDGRAGASALFVGSMRDFNMGDHVNELYLEYYPGMTERELNAITTEAETRWPLVDTLLIHRVGRIQIGEAIVLIAAWSTHRAAAFEACRYLIEALKERAPFWKRETLEDGSQRWVDRNTPR